MPTYNYRCAECEYEFEEFCRIDDRDKACQEACQKCSKTSVERTIGGMPSIASDSTLTPDKATGGDWSELMGRMKKGLPKRLHDGLDRSTSQTGRRHYG